MTLINNGHYQEQFVVDFHYLTHRYCMYTLLFCPDAENYYPSVDANGNVESSDKVSLPWFFLLNPSQFSCGHTEY